MTAIIYKTQPAYRKFTFNHLIMRSINTLLSLFILVFISLACSDKEDDVFDERLSDDVPISFRLDGDMVEIDATSDNLFVANYIENFALGFGFAQIYGAYNGQFTNLDKYNGGEVIQLGIMFQGKLEEGTYPFSDEVNTVLYLNNALDAEYISSSGNITITELDLAGIAEGKGLIAGTFETVLEKDDGSDDAPDKLTITDGVFRYTNVNDILID